MRVDFLVTAGYGWLMRRSIFLALFAVAACTRAEPSPSAAAPASASAPGISKEVADMTAQTHRDMCAATREIRVQQARDKAQEWLAAMQRISGKNATADDKAFKATLGDSSAWEKRPITAYPTGIGAVDTCQDEDAKVGLNTTPELGDIKAIKALMAWHP